jgi:transposase
MEGSGAARPGEPGLNAVGARRVIQIAPQIRILVAVEPIDARKGIDSLAQLCREKLAADPFSGCLFIFRSRRGTAIKLLAYDGQGFWLTTKRLSKGRFRWRPTGNEPARTCARIRRSCYWLPATRTRKPRPSGAASARKHSQINSACVPDFSPANYPVCRRSGNTADESSPRMTSARRR